MSASQILVVDDETAIRQVMASYIKRAGYMVDLAGSGEEALEKLSGGDFDIAICDIKMSGISGIEMVKKARAANIETTFLMMTAHASVNTAIDAMKAGAYDYMIKPMREEDVLRRLAQIDTIIGMRNENRALRSIVLGEQERHCTLKSAAHEQVKRLIDKVAPTDNTVLITGESGTGKGVVAKEIHRHSRRAEAPFIPVNCGAIPENLIESELFGHVKGAFTGAVKAKKGLFLEANSGTIFLDEIGELPLHLQVKLLHVLEEKAVRPVGSEQTRSVDIRIITATNRDLADMIENGMFREDLYFRINVFNVHIAPLRERREDVATLTEFFMGREAKKLLKTTKFTLDQDAEEIIMNHDWPGNVRELENVISRATTLADGDQIIVADLPPQITKVGQFPGAAVIPEFTGKSLKDQVKAFEINVISRAISQASGDRRLAAHQLGIGLSSLYRKLEEIEKSEGIKESEENLLLRSQFRQEG